MRVQTMNLFPSQTIQEAKDECDINNIMEQYARTGEFTHVNKTPGQYADATALEFTNSMEIILHAQEQFSELPSDVRKFFDNDPRAFLEYCEDPANEQTLIDLGLATPRNKTPQNGSTEPTEASMEPQGSETPSPAA